MAYKYDADGIRVSQTLDPTGAADETRFLLDANRPYAQVLEEYTPGGIIKVSYVFGNDLISQNRGGAKSSYHVDGLGSTRALSDVSGLVTDRYIYDAFGRTIAGFGSTENGFLFAGDFRDPETGLDYLRARWMDTRVGRFVNRDTFGGVIRTPITLNHFLYSNSDPANQIDPTGNSSISVTIAGLGVQATLTQIFSAVYLPMLLKGGLLLATAYLLRPGLEVRAVGLELMANEFDFGYDLFQEGNAMILAATNFAELGNSIIDYGIAGSTAFSLLRAPVKTVLNTYKNISVFGKATGIDKQGLQTLVFRIEEVDTLLVQLVDDIQLSSVVFKQVTAVRDFSQKLFELNNLIAGVFNSDFRTAYEAAK